MPARLPFIVIAGLAVSGLCRYSGAAELLTTDGTWLKGAARSSSGDGGGRLTVAGRTVPVDRIVALRLNEAALGEGWADTVEEAMVLTNGDLLVGTVRGLQAGKVSFLSESLGHLSLPAGSVAALSFRPRGVADLMGSGSGPAGAELVNGDFVRGEVVWVNEEAIGVNSGRRIVRVPRARTALVRLGPRRQEGTVGPTGPLKGARGRVSVQLVRLANGDRFSGRLRRLSDDTLELDTSFAGTVKLPVAMVAELWSEGGPLVPVSALKPVEVVQTPQFDESFPHRLDRSQTGSFLSVGGRRFERGIGCHSRCEIEYDLSGAFSSFIAEIGIDDSVGARGEAVFRVLVDGKPVFESPPVRGGEAPRMVRVSVRRARRMRLVVDFGPDGSSVADRADWGRAVLVRR